MNCRINSPEDKDANSIIELQQCSKSYGPVSALHAIDLSIIRGERLVVMGPSGAGKSTLLRVIAGLESCDQGTVTLNSEEACRVPPAERGIAMVTQDYALYPQLTVARNILAATTKRKLSKSQASGLLDQLLHKFELQELSERKPSQLSGGQRQRTCFAKALASDPQILLLDEPFSQQDPELAERARELIDQVTEQNELTVVLITHAPLDALQLADRILILDRGTVVQCDKPESLYRNPNSEVALRLLSPLGVNCIPAELVGETVSPFAWVGESRPSAKRIMFRIEQVTALPPREPPQNKGLLIQFESPTERFTPFGIQVQETLLNVEVRALRQPTQAKTSRFFVPVEACQFN